MALLRALRPRVYEKWFATLLRTELVRQLPPYYERGYEYETQLESAAFNSYYSGKLKAGSEANKPVTITKDDLDRIHRISDEFEQDMEEILRDLHADPQPNMERYEWRTNLVAQMLTWSSYNDGKLEAVKEFKQRFVRFRTAEDERVCDECFSAEGIYPIEEVRVPPLHPNCRCELEYTEAEIPMYPSVAEFTYEIEPEVKMPGDARERIKRILREIPQKDLQGITRVTVADDLGKARWDDHYSPVAGNYYWEDKKGEIYIKNSLLKEENWAREILHHEAGHHVYHQHTRGRYEYKPGIWVEDITWPEWDEFYVENREIMPTDYAKWAGSEGFAECYQHWRDGKALDPKIKSWLEKNVG